LSEREIKTLNDPSITALAEESLSSLDSFTPNPILNFDEDDTRMVEEHLSFACPVDHAGASVHVQGWAGIHSEYPPVILVHDLGENSDFYAPAARILAQHGFQAYCYDMRGHGRSSPLDNKTLGFHNLIQDLLQVVAWIRYKSNRRKPFLIAQGLGALVVLHFQKSYPQYCTRSILIAPTFEEQTALPFFSRVFLRSMAQILPWAVLPSTLLPYFLPMSDEASQKASSLEMNARFAYDLREAVRTAAGTFLEVSSPNLIGCPVDDSIYNCEHLKKLVMRHPFADILSFREIEGIGANALCGDPSEIDNALAVIIPWMLEICPSSNASLL
jgi:pimeloyl-ACP methyl ester carboxylesterase